VDKRLEEELSQIGEESAVAVFSIFLRTIIRGSLSYAFISVAGAGLYGLLSIFLRFQQIISSTLSGVMSAIIRTVPRLKRNAQDAVVTASFPVVLCLWIVVVGFFAAFPDEIVSVTALTQSETEAVSVFGALCLPFMLFPVYTGVFESHRRITELNLSKSIGLPLGILIGAVGAGAASFGLLGAWVAISCSVGAVSLLVGYRVYSLHGFQHPNNFSDSVREFLTYTRDASVIGLLATAQYSAVFILMAVFLRPVEAGLFSLAHLLSKTVRWPLDAVNQIFPPIMTSLYHDEKTGLLDSLNTSTSVCVVCVAIPAAAGGIAFASEILTGFSSRYASGSAVLSVMILGELAAGAAGSVGNLLKMTDNQRASILVQALVVAVLAAPAVWLSRNFGALGLAIAASSSLILNNVLELAAIYRLAGLWPLNQKHALLTGMGLLLGALTWVAKHVVGVPAGLVAFLTGLAIYYETCAEFVLGREDKLVLRSVPSTFRRYLGRV
jgi:O-antigen/teichoic acid export membrane protein